MKQRETFIYRLLLVILYIPFSLLVFQGLQVACSDILDFHKFFVMLPLYLSYIVLPIYLLIVFYMLSFPRSYERFLKTLCGNAIALIVLGLLLIVMVPSYVASGLYDGFLISTIAPLYPLDILLYGIVGLLLGYILLLRYLLRDKTKSQDVNYEAIYRKRSLAKIIIYSFLSTLYLMLALYFMGAFFFSFISFDFSNPYLGAFVPTYLLMIYMTLLLAFAVYFVRSGYLKRKGIIMPSLFVIGTLTLTLVIALIITNSLIPEVYIEIAKPLFPLDFMGSLNVAPLLLTLSPLIGFLIASCEQLFERAKSH